MVNNNVIKILEAIEKIADKQEAKWKEEKPKLEKTFGKVTNSGDHEMDNVEAKYPTVKDGGNKKINTDPKFSNVKQEKGAVSNAKPTATKNPYKEGVEPKIDKTKKESSIKESDMDDQFNYGPEKIPKFGKKQPSKDEIYKNKNYKGAEPITHAPKPVEKEIKEEEELTEMSTNMKKLSGRNPSINETENFENSLSENVKEKVKKIREAIELISGKKLIYLTRK